MRQNKYVKEAGPYHVTSHSQGRGYIYFIVYPSFPKYNDEGFKWAENRYEGNGGGPSIFTSMATADSLSEFLNSVYPKEEIDDWEKRITTIIDDSKKDNMIATCDKCGILSNISKDWIYCPICGSKWNKGASRE